MSKHQYKEKIVINKDYDHISTFLKKLPSVFMETGDTIYEERNTIKTFDIDGIKLNVKSFKKPHLINQVAYATVRESKAKRSYYYAKKLLNLGVNTPAPIAYMEYSKPLLLKHSLYVCEHFEMDGQMRILQGGSLEEHKELIVAFAKYTAQLHELMVFHIDYSSGNILYKKVDGEYIFYLIDLNRMEFDKEISLKKACHNFRRLWGSNEMLALFAKVYAQERALDVDECLFYIFKYRLEFWQKFNKNYPDVKPYWGEEKIKIGYDAKRATQNFTGLGNYSRFIIKNMASLFPHNSYYLYSPRPASDKIQKELNGFGNITHIVKHGFQPLWRTTGIVKDINKQKIDIYHGLSNELPVGIRNTKAKSIVTIHDLIFKIYPHFYKFIDRTIYDAKAKYACRNADKIIAVSECTKRDIIQLYNIKPEQVEVVYQGCHPIFEEKVTEEYKLNIKAKYNLPDKYILSVGSIEERKNILLVVKALEEIPNIHFVAIGKRRNYAKIVEQYAQDNNLSDRVHIFSGIPLDHLPAIFQQASIFVYPSLYEGFGIPLLEAQSSGLPIISAIGSCLEEAGGPHSIYVDPTNHVELAHEIKRVLEDEGLRNYMINEGLEYIKRFSEEACISNLEKVYRSLL